VSPAEVKRLQSEYAIYMVDSSRINVAGINGANIDYFVDAMAKVIGG
jgi:aspartate aminotransferase